MFQSSNTPLVITKIREEALGVKSFSVASTTGEPVIYEAGQFLTLVIKSGAKEERRSYSFASSPAIDVNPFFTVKRIDNGLLSRRLIDSAKPGDELVTVGSAGFFTLPPDVDKYEQLFFFAGGIGITPVFSLIKTALHTVKNVHLTLVYSNRSIANTVFYTELQQLAADFPTRFHIIYLFSSAADLSMARLSKELVPQLLKEYLGTGVDKTLFYICGPFAYMRMVVFALEEQYIPAANIRRENFNTHPVSIRPVPPDTMAHTVNLKLDGKLVSFPSQYPDTILRSAEKHGIALPYSCRNGVCGSCAMHCKKGDVWHRYNEVLTDLELSSGIILTCTGYAINGDVDIEI